MSSIKLLKDHANSKKGDIISVPFVDGRHMIAQGIGEWFDSTKAEPKPLHEQDRIVKPLPTPVPPLIQHAEPKKQEPEQHKHK